MTAITSGRVVYSRTVKTGDFENKKFEVELCFNVDEGQDGGTIVVEVGGLCVQKCHEMLGLALRSSQPKTDVKTVAEPATKEASAAAMNAKDKQQTATETTPAVDTTKKKPGRPPKVQATDDLDTPTPPKAEKPVETATDDFDTPLPAKEVTDVDLTSAASRKNAELAKVHAGAAPSMVRKLIGTFFAEPTGKRVSDIPQDKRQAFLDQLEALK